MTAIEDYVNQALKLWDYGDEKNDGNAYISAFGLMKKAFDESKLPRIASFCSILAYKSACVLPEKRANEYINHAKKYSSQALELDNLEFRAQLVKLWLAFDNLKSINPEYAKNGWLYKGSDAASSIVGSAFSILGKGIGLGISGATVAASRSNFKNELLALFQLYKERIEKYYHSPDEFIYLTETMLEIANSCVDMNMGDYLDIFNFISQLDLEDSINYDGIEDEEEIKTLKREAERLKFMAIGRANL